MGVDQPRNERGEWSSGSDAGNQPVQSHGGQASVHTNLRVRQSAKAEILALRKRSDESRYPTHNDAEVGIRTVLGKPMGSQTSSPGRFKYQTPKN